MVYDGLRNGGGGLAVLFDGPLDDFGRLAIGARIPLAWYRLVSDGPLGPVASS